ncbi:MAG: maltose alpha-D-glucosyltransferase [Phycisphaeraceae bacterium]|nr:maltose alpha-D-glucosyltransferase [Phycisphaeraceae bacterium]
MNTSSELKETALAAVRNPAKTSTKSKTRSTSAVDPLWFKNAVVYQLHVRSFCDSTGDGVGDFNGLISKLDYLADLGVTALWLQPFYPSPLRDDGYDIADYMGVNPAYGRVEDFRDFVSQAHKRGLRVITELVINHTSDKHAWFEAARRAPKGSPQRNFYVWSDTPDLYRDARIIFKDFERSNWTWDPVAEQYFWHRFYSHQPDLNFDNPAVHKAVFDVCDFWMKMGVDGVRLDAIPYLYEREGTSCENLEETHAFLRKFRAHVDEHWPGRMLLAEANQWPEDAVAYFGKGDECHMAFHFPLMPRLFMALRMEDRFPIIDILDQTPAIPSTCQWAIFLRNHDELTLEMVTDEERDYMYRVYASDPQARINLGIRRRLAPLLSNNRRKIELMNALLYSMPGTPIMYYGDEIGMGDNVHLGDRNGVRTPMQWSADRNAGFSRANPQKLFLPAIIDPEYHYEAVNAESQLANPSSMLWWMKRLIALRKRYPVFGSGDIRFLHPSNAHVLAFTRSDQNHTILVVANLSRFVQPVSLPLAEFEGLSPIEIFGKVPFPTIGRSPYFLSMGPHAFLWFLLENPAGGGASSLQTVDIPELRVDGAWDRVWNSEALRRGLERMLPPMVSSKRWFVSKARGPRNATILDRLRLPSSNGVTEGASLFVASFEFRTGEAESYALPMLVREPTDQSKANPAVPDPSLIARLVNSKGETRELVDALASPDIARTVLRLALTGDEVETGSARLIGKPVGRKERASAFADLPVRTPKLEQSNSTVFFGDKYVLKMFRKLSDGESPEAEIGRHLTEKVPFPHIAPLAGSVEIQSETAQDRTLAVALKFVASQGDAWGWMLDRAMRFLEGVAALPSETAAALTSLTLPGQGDSASPPTGLSELLSEPLEAAKLLGLRTAELHVALGTDAGDPAFTPEPFSPMYQRAVLQSIRNSLRSATAALAQSAANLDGDAVAMAKAVLQGETKLAQIISPLRQKTLGGLRIRIHGDYHLGQVLHTGKDFIIIDFEGEPLRSIGERRIKRSPLRDVAGMVRSFDYAAWASLHKYGQLIPGERAGAQAALTQAARAWSQWTGRAFINAYFERVSALQPKILGQDLPAHELLLRAWLLDKICYEIVYELNSRPEWVHIPLRAAVSLLGGEAAPGPTEGGAS